MVLNHPAVLGTITVRRSPGSDQYGDPLPAVEHQVSDCWWAPKQGSEERTDGRDTIISGQWLGGPHDADVRGTDQVILPGVLDDAGQPAVWQVDGEIGRWTSPHRGGAKVGFYCSLRRFRG